MVGRLVTQHSGMVEAAKRKTKNKTKSHDILPVHKYCVHLASVEFMGFFSRRFCFCTCRFSFCLVHVSLIHSN